MLKRLRETVDARDLLALAGLALLGIGASLYDPRAWPVVVGAALFYLGVFHR